MKSSYRRRLFLSILISIIFIVPIVRALNFNSLEEIVRRANVWYLLAGFCSLALANVIRTYRFRELDHSHAGLVQWWIMNSVYNASTATLPGGAGEAVTAFLIKKAFRLNLATSLRILVVARIMDLGCISVLLFLSSLAVTGLHRELARWLSLLFFSVSVILVVPASERFFLGMLQRLFASEGKAVSLVRRQIDNIAEAAEARGNRQPHTALLQSVGIWVGASFCLYFLLMGFGVEFTILQSIYCFGIYALFQLVPVQGFAGIGTQAAWWIMALTASGYQNGDAASIGIVLHGTFYMFIGTIALLTITCWRFLASRKV